MQVYKSKGNSRFLLRNGVCKKIVEQLLKYWKDFELRILYPGKKKSFKNKDEINTFRHVKAEITH